MPPGSARATRDFRTDSVTRAISATSTTWHAVVVTCCAPEKAMATASSSAALVAPSLCASNPPYRAQPCSTSKATQHQQSACAN